MRPKSAVAAIAIGSLAATLSISAVQAQRGTDPAGLVEQRQARMKALGGSMKTLSGFAKGEASAADAAKAAGVLAAAGRAMPGWWARGTGVGVSDSEALPAVWADPQRFRQQLVAFERASAQMQRAAAAGDAAKVGAELRTLGGSCKSCHDGFRIKD
jgi:cytochrome c556